MKNTSCAVLAIVPVYRGMAVMSFTRPVMDYWVLIINGFYLPVMSSPTGTPV